MSFNAVLSAIETQLKADATLLGYVNASQISIGYREIPAPARYAIIIEPGGEEENNRSEGGYANFTYSMDIYARIMHGGSIEDNLLTTTDFGKGLLAFVDDIKAALRADKDFGLNSSGTSMSAAGVSTSYNVGPNSKHLKIKINGFNPIGYDEIGVADFDSNTIVSGEAIAATLQANIRALDDEANGYGQATVSYDNNTKKFTITSAGLTGPESFVEVTAGATASADIALGFDNPTETRGVQIINLEFGPVSDSGYDLYPVRYRVIPIEVIEEKYISEN